MENKNLNKSKNELNNDEFYTKLQDIEKEVVYYKDFFKNKIVYCNCDDYKKSNFVQFFINHFDDFGLKELITTSYNGEDEQINLWATRTDKKPAYKLVVNKLGRFETILNGNGDFESKECLELLKTCDVVVTNPPFSLFRNFINRLEEYNKKYLIVGNFNAITYKDVFNLIRDNKLWLGLNEIHYFIKPNGEEQKFGNINWFTNIPNNSRQEEIKLSCSYDSSAYPTYENFNAIEVSKIKDIPKDYNDLMGVPITFLNHYNPNQFKIIGSTSTFELTRELGVRNIPNEFKEKFMKQGNGRNLGNNVPLLCYYKDNKAIIPYARIIIKKI